MWTPSNEIVSCILSALSKKRSPPKSLCIEPTKPSGVKSNAPSAVVDWPLTPFSKPSRTKYSAYKSSDSDYVPAHLHSTAIQSGLERLKVTYGSVYKHPSVWGPASRPAPILD